MVGLKFLRCQCGSRLERSREKGYSFYCPLCKKDFFSIEVRKTCNLSILERKMRVIT